MSLGQKKFSLIYFYFLRGRFKCQVFYLKTFYENKNSIFFFTFDHVSLFYLTLVVLSHSSVNFLGMRLCHCKGTCSYIKRKTLLSTVLYYYDFITALDIATVIWIINPFCFIYFFPKLYIGQDTRDINIFS